MGNLAPCLERWTQIPMASRVGRFGCGPISALPPLQVCHRSSALPLAAMGPAPRRSRGRSIAGDIARPSATVRPASVSRLSLSPSPRADGRFAKPNAADVETPKSCRSPDLPGLSSVRYPCSVSSSLHPSEGIRLLLDRESVAEDKANAVYVASIYTTSEVFTYRATLGLDGTAVVDASGAEASEADTKQLTNIAKSTARAAKRKLDEDLPPWPPRILRWRAPR